MNEKFFNKIIATFTRRMKKCFYYFCFIFHVKKNRIICDNFCGNNYNDNPKYIVEELIRRNKYLNIYWSLKKSNYDIILPNGIKKVKYNSFKYFYLLATSKIWIDNVRMPFRIRKRKKQFYVQTWHGGLGFKRIEKDAAETLPDNYINSAICDSKNIDLLLTNCKWQEDYFKKYFWYDGDILVEGLPRNDILINKKYHNEISKRVRTELNIEENTKIVMYAPTFRNNHNFDCYNIDFNKTINILEKKSLCKWKILVRLHPNMSDYKFDYNNIIDVTNYPNLSELLIASNVLISDYSSVVFDFALLNKPVFIFATDIDAYIKERGFAISLFDVPFLISKNNDELFNNINNFDNSNYIIDLKTFFAKNGLNETGHASKTTANIILNYINKQEVPK